MGAGEGRACSVAGTLNLIGEKWSLLVIRELMLGSTRFEQIVQFTGAPRDVLTARLRKLEAEGFVERVRYQERPTRYEYHLTGLGRSLQPIITVLRHWGDVHLERPGGPPVLFEHECGRILEPVVACQACGDAVRWGSLDAHPGPGWSPEEARQTRND